MNMYIVTILIGVLIVFMGKLVGKNPVLISGYNHLSSEEINSRQFKMFVAYIEKVCIYAGAISMIGGIMAYFFQSDVMCLLCLIFSLFFVSVEFQRKRGDKKKWIFVTFLFLLCLILSLLTISYSGVSVEMYKEQLKIKSLIYKTTIDRNNVEEMRIVDGLPNIKQRRNGYSFNGVRLGNFVTSQGTRVKLYLCSKKPPYIYIKLKSGEICFINMKDSVNTMKIFNEKMIFIENEGKFNLYE